MKWEYKVIKVWTATNNLGEYDLNELGKYGWELVTVHKVKVDKLNWGLRGREGQVYFFKRGIRLL